MTGDFSVFGSGEESRDYLYVEDVARAFISILEKADFSGEAINIASGNETRIVDLSRMVYAALGTVNEPILCPKHGPEFRSVGALMSRNFKRLVSLRTSP